MPASQVLLIRHAEAQISADALPSDWPLAPAGLALAADLGRTLALQFGDERTTLVASSERKAIETAYQLSDSTPQIDASLREVAKPWYRDPADHREGVIRYLRGMRIAGWEPQSDAIERFGTAISARREQFPVVTSHGTVMSLWLGATLSNFDPVAFWLDLQFPDAHLLVLGTDPTIRRV